MKIPLTQTVALKLNINIMPELGDDGTISYVPNPAAKWYVVIDSSPNSPVGFGMQINKFKKTYIIDRRINGKHIKAKVGNFTDFNSINEARERARGLIGVAIETQRNPNKVKNEFENAKITLGEAFARYKKSLSSRATPAKPNTMRLIEKAERKLQPLINKQITSITSKDVLELFDKLVAEARTACEQSFRWGTAAVKYCIFLEEQEALQGNREPTIRHNPFNILHLEKKFRTRSELERDYKLNNARNPMSQEELGRWLSSCMKYRDKGNRTGGDYLLLTLLLGTRRSELFNLRWIEEVRGAEQKQCSWVDLGKRTIFLYDTKNRSDHTIPVCDGAYKLLKERRAIVLEEFAHNFDKSQYVFPPVSKVAKLPHYSDAKSLFSYIKKDAGIEKLGIHDLRRTFGRMAEESGVSYSLVKRMLNHRNTADVTERYTEVQWDRLARALQTVEVMMLSTCPKLYNLLLSPKHPPLVEK